LGVSERIRVPWPAARMRIVGAGVEESDGRVEAARGVGGVMGRL
jgi:hypothetical protein